MANLWPNCSKTINNLWLNDTNTKAELWPNDDKIMAKLWPNYGKTIVKWTIPWQIQINSMAVYGRTIENHG